MNSNHSSHISTLYRKKREYRKNMKLKYNKCHKVVVGEQVNKNDKLCILDLKASGQVIDNVAPRSFLIQTPNGMVRRNRRMVRKVPSQEPTCRPPTSWEMQVPMLVPRSAPIIMPDQTGITTSEKTRDQPVRAEGKPPRAEERNDDNQAVTIRRSGRHTKRPAQYIEQY